MTVPAAMYQAVADMLMEQINARIPEKAEIIALRAELAQARSVIDAGIAQAERDKALAE